MDPRRNPASHEFRNEIYKEVKFDRSGFRYDNALLVSDGLVGAVVAGDLQNVIYMVSSGMSVNTSDENGTSPLHVAAMKNNLEILDYLLTQTNIDVDVRNINGETPLYQAVQYGTFESMRRIILAGANVNLPNYDGMTPLHVSVTCQKLGLFLILHGGYIDAVDCFGDTPLHYAVYTNCLDTVCMLLFFNADVNVAGCNSLTPFMSAIMIRDIGIQQVLIEYVVDFDVITYFKLDMLGLALKYRSPYVREIIQRGDDINYASISYRSSTMSDAFFICTYTPDHHNFKLIWDRLKCDENVRSIDLCLLFAHLLQPSIIEKYIDVIIESNNVKVAVASFLANENYHEFILHFVWRKLKLEQLTKLTCRLILFEYHVTNYDIYEIYTSYGYCELFKMLLYMKNDFSYEWFPFMAVPRLIFDLNFKLNSDTVRVIVKIGKCDILKLLQYFNYPRLTKALLRKYSNDDKMTQVINELPKVPLLIEFARDRTREHIAKVFNTTSTCQFYTIVNCLNISIIYKKILTFEKKLYNVQGPT